MKRAGRELGKGRGPGCYSKANGGSFAARTSVTGLETWRGHRCHLAAESRVFGLAQPREGSGSRVLRTSPPTLSGLAVFPLSQDALPHVGDGDCGRAHLPAGSLGAVLPREGHAVLPSSLRPGLSWFQLETDFFVS